MSVLNNEIEKYLSNLYTPLSDEIGELRKEAEMDRVPIILRDTEKFLINLIKMMQIKNILEIGTAVGYSSSCFACISDNIKVTTLEKSVDMYEIACNNIQKLNLYDRIEIINADAVEWMKEREAEPIYDMIFIDGPKGQYNLLWNEAKKLIKNGGIIVVDNVLFRGFVAGTDEKMKKKYGTIIRRLNEFLENISKDENSSILAIGDGVSLTYVGR